MKIGLWNIAVSELTGAFEIKKFLRGHFSSVSQERSQIKG